MKSRQADHSQETAAAKAGISVRSGRRIEKGERQDKIARHWRTREDPFDAVWSSELVPLLEREPTLTGITLWVTGQTRPSFPLASSTANLWFSQSQETNHVR